MKIRRYPAKASGKQGEIIGARLEETGISRNELARQMGVNVSFISRVVSGEKRITTDDRIQQAAEILGMNSDQLYLAIDTLPPDVEHAIQRHPQMLAIIRQAAAKLDQRKED